MANLGLVRVTGSFKRVGVFVQSLEFGFIAFGLRTVEGRRLLRTRF